MSPSVLAMVIKWEKPRTKDKKIFKSRKCQLRNVLSKCTQAFISTVLMNSTEKKKKFWKKTLCSITHPAFFKKTQSTSLRQKKVKFSRSNSTGITLENSRYN